MSTIKANQWLNLDNTENYKCRAWVNFNGVGTVTILGSGNVSSITDLGVGRYQVNLTTALPDTNFSAIAAAQFTSTSDPLVNIRRDTDTVSNFELQVYQSTALLDLDGISVAVFR